MTKPRLHLLLGLLSVLIIAASAPVHAQSQMEMNATAADDAEKADKELNVTYQKLRASLKDDDKSRALLQAAEQAWLVYRDKEAEYEAASDIGGSIYPMAVSVATRQLTEERTKYLKALLKDGPNVP